MLSLLSLCCVVGFFHIFPLRKTVNKFEGAVNTAVDGLSDLTDEVKEVGKDLGQLASGIADLASHLVGPFKELLKCIGSIFNGDMCPFVLHKFCDCPGGSHLKFQIDTNNAENSNVDMKCILKLGFWAAQLFDKEFMVENRAPKVRRLQE